MTRLGRHMLPLSEVYSKPTGFGRCVAFATALAAVFSFAATAQAQVNDSKVTSSKTQISAPAALPASNASKASDFSLKLPSSSTTRLLDLNLDFDSIGCLVGEKNCLRDSDPVDIGVSTSIAKNSDKGLDLELVPTASMSFDENSRSAIVGAVVRIGEDLRSKDVNSNTWYVFAGADAEALSYSPESMSGLTRGELGLSDRIIIGDAQAGIGYRIGSADVSLGYIRREISTLNDSPGSEGFSKREDAAALSFTWKR